ncbi:MAG TPA: hypothetical protein DEB39_01510 [Planctomycetaceae bacterium]|nr:hypothetical protein [Planctomycetaceae bacterium]
MWTTKRKTAWKTVWRYGCPHPRMTRRMIRRSERWSESIVPGKKRTGKNSTPRSGAKKSETHRKSPRRLLRNRRCDQHGNQRRPSRFPHITRRFLPGNTRRHP